MAGKKQKEREPYATNINRELKEAIIQLSEITRIPQSKLIDEAILDLIKKYKPVLITLNENK